MKAGTLFVETGTPLVETGTPAMDTGSPVLETGTLFLETGAPVSETGVPECANRPVRGDARSPKMRGADKVVESQTADFISRAQDSVTPDPPLARRRDLAGSPEAGAISPAAVRPA